MKSNFFNKILYAILVVLVCTTNFAYAKNPNIAAIKTIAVKFSLAMIGVVLFSILICVGLSLYNRFFVAAQIKDFKLSKESMRSPRDEDDAIMMFITKNRLK